jgi:hypothetical protein
MPPIVPDSVYTKIIERAADEVFKKIDAIAGETGDSSISLLILILIAAVVLLAFLFVLYFRHIDRKADKREARQIAREDADRKERQDREDRSRSERVSISAQERTDRIAREERAATERIEEIKNVRADRIEARGDIKSTMSAGFGGIRDEIKELAGDTERNRSGVAVNGSAVAVIGAKQELLEQLMREVIKHATN